MADAEELIPSGGGLINVAGGQAALGSSSWTGGINNDVGGKMEGSMKSGHSMLMINGRGSWATSPHPPRISILEAAHGMRIPPRRAASAQVHGAPHSSQRASSPTSRASSSSPPSNVVERRRARNQDAHDCPTHHEETRMFLAQSKIIDVHELPVGRFKPEGTALRLLEQAGFAADRGRRGAHKRLH